MDYLFCLYNYNRFFFFDRLMHIYIFLSAFNRAVFLNIAPRYVGSFAELATTRLSQGCRHVTDSIRFQGQPPGENAQDGPEARRPGGLRL
jgi:hypothetical protein